MSLRHLLAVLGTALLASATALPINASEREIRNSVVLGALIYSDVCSNCHQIDGYGEERLYPSLHRSALLKDRDLLIRTILNGKTRHRSSGNDDQMQLMPALGFLTNKEIVSIIAFITNSWGDDLLLVTEEEVEKARKALQAQEQQRSPEQ